MVAASARGFDVRIIYLGTALSGLTALGGQVVWTRLLTLLFGATVFAFAIILAVFLAGLGIGSAAAAGMLRRGLSPIRGLAWSQLLLVPAILLAAFLLARVLPYASPGALTPVHALHGLHVVRAVVVILPSAVLWGMSFPFALAAVNQAGGDPGRSSGFVYASNTVGAILGALVVSFWAIPTYGTKWAEQFLVVLAALSAAILFYGARRKKDESPARAAWEIPPAWALAAGFIAAAALPGLSKVFLAHGRYIWWVDPRDQYPYVSEGASSTVAVHIAPDGYKNFHVSGRVEATNNPNDLRTERLIGHLTGLTHPHPKSVLVVGLGGGVSAGALALYPEVKRIVICEIEPRVVGAANQFAAENYSVLTDPRVEIVFDDARHFLATTREKFDVITSDPIHPWVRGNSILFSREYYEIVKARLEPGGIATQWVPLYETSELAIQIQMRTFMDAFPNGTVWNTAITGKRLRRGSRGWRRAASTRHPGRRQAHSQQPEALPVAPRREDLERGRFARDLRNERRRHEKVARRSPRESRLQLEARIHLGTRAERGRGRSHLRAHDCRSLDPAVHGYRSVARRAPAPARHESGSLTLGQPSESPRHARTVRTTTEDP